MQRVFASWPYLLGVVALSLGWIAIGKSPLSPDAATNLMTTYAGTLVPVVLAIGGAILGYRRGYDWVTVVVCLLTWVILLVVGSIAISGAPAAVDATVAAIVAYTFVAHVGIVAALGIKRLGPTKPIDRSGEKGVK